MESITLNGIEYAYDSAPVLQDICLTIRKGEFFTLLGSSGCGKTTLLRLMAGFLKPDKGTIAIDGRDITPSHRKSAAWAWCFKIMLCSPI